MVSRKAISSSALVLALALALTGCSGATGSGDAPDEGTPFTIYASLGVTGPVAASAAANIAGLEAAAAAVNKDGGIDSRQVKVVVKDDGLDPAKATTLLQEQLDSGPIDLAIPGSVSNVGLAMIAALTREGIVSSGQQATLADGEKYPYHFGMVVPNPTQVSALVDGIVSDVGPEKVGILHANDANGQAVGEAYQAAFKDAGIATVSQEFAPTDVDMTAQLQALQADKPDALVLQGFGAVAGYTLKSRTKLGWDIPTYGHADYGTIDLAKISGPADWKKVKLLTYYPLDATTTRTAGYQQLLDGLAAGGVTVTQPLAQYALFWDLVFVAKAAWESTDSSDPKVLAAAWLALDEQGTPDSPYVYMPYYKFLDSTHQYDIEAKDAMRIVDPGPIVDGVFTTGK